MAGKIRSLAATTTPASCQVKNRSGTRTLPACAFTTIGAPVRATMAEAIVRHLGGRFEPGGPVCGWEALDGPARVVLWVKLPRGRTRAQALAPDRLRDGLGRDGALDLLDEEFEVWVVTDACASRTERNRDAAYDRLAGAGAEMVTTEMVLFEWLRTAEHPDFRAAQALIK